MPNKNSDRSLRTYLSTRDIDGCTKSDSSEVRFLIGPTNYL